MSRPAATTAGTQDTEDRGSAGLAGALVGEDSVITPTSPAPRRTGCGWRLYYPDRFVPGGPTDLAPPSGATAELAARWAAAERVVVLTGAGISTASGIPDFRSPGGRWERYQPVTLQAFLASEEKRAEYWSYKGETWRLIQQAHPNAAHRALSSLAAADRLDLLVTQNVDGLHERSGFPAERLVAIHGTDSRVQCFGCDARAPREAAQAQWEAGVAVPLCGCGAPWKPATISFGQALVEEDLARAFQAAATCDLFVAIGSSLAVGPINQMFPRAVRAGAVAAILTASDTPFDAEARWKITDPVERSLPAIAEAVLG